MMLNELIKPYKTSELADVVVLGVPYDRTASFRRGCAKGPAAILSALLHQIEPYDRWTNSVPADTRKIAYLAMPLMNRYMPKAMISRVERQCALLHKKNAFVFLLGGEHTVTLGALQALAIRHPAREITIFQIDAHLDLHDTDADYRSDYYGKNAHGTVMRRAHEDLGYQCVSVGARAYGREEMDYAHENGISVFEWKGDKAPAPSEIVDAITTELVYVTLDVDGIDPAFMPATGTPVQGGLDWYYTIELLSEIFKKKKVVGADIVEVAPRPGDVATEYGAAQLCYTMIGLLTRLKADKTLKLESLPR
jgi:agmatinase